MTSNTVSMRGALLENLMGVSTSDFVRSYWGRTYRHVSCGLEKIHGVLGGPWGLSDWRAATERAYRFPGSTRNLQVLPAARSPFGHRAIQPDEIDAVLSFGATVIGDVLDVRLSEMAAALKNELNVPGPVSTYATLSPSCEAAFPHYDSSHVFAIQLEGRKQWRISRAPVVINPSSGRRISADGTVDSRERLEDETVERVDLDDLDTIVLEPGDILYMPIGTVHATVALGRSLSIMFNFAPPRFDALVELIVRRTLGADARWRGVPAAGLDDAHLDYLNEGLERLRGVLSSLDAGSPEVLAAWDEMTANLGPVQNGFAASQHPAEAVALEPDQRLKMNGRYPVRYSERIDGDGELRVVVYLGDVQIADRGAGAEFLKQVVERRQFKAEDACYWSGDAYDWEVVRAYMENLVRQGLLVVG